jgi:hypothetical protein
MEEYLLANSCITQRQVNELRDKTLGFDFGYFLSTIIEARDLYRPLVGGISTHVASQIGAWVGRMRLLRVKLVMVFDGLHT